MPIHLQIFSLRNGRSLEALKPNIPLQALTVMHSLCSLQKLPEILLLRKLGSKTSMNSLKKIGSKFQEQKKTFTVMDSVKSEDSSVPLKKMGTSWLIT